MNNCFFADADRSYYLLSRLIPLISHECPLLRVFLYILIKTVTLWKVKRDTVNNPNRVMIITWIVPVQLYQRCLVVLSAIYSIEVPPTSEKVDQVPSKKDVWTT